MDKGISAATAWRLADTLRGKAEVEVPQTGTATFVRTDADGTAWIRIPGNDFDTPVEGGVTASASAGDTVSYSIGGGRVSVTGNVSAPSTSASHVDEVVAPVSEMAQSAVRDAGLAAAAADSAQA
ncbi:MAG: hypothetical protein IJ092_00900, partial [Atopobiaceae bacterium]|nr:hypothetical protein [Atopobiaceae bacterium]